VIKIEFYQNIFDWMIVCVVKGVRELWGEVKVAVRGGVLCCLLLQSIDKQINKCFSSGILSLSVFLRRVAVFLRRVALLEKRVAVFKGRGAVLGNSVTLLGNRVAFNQRTELLFFFSVLFFLIFLVGKWAFIFFIFLSC